MRKRKILLIIVAVLSMTGIHAQTLKLLEATSQHWSGGICCIYGVRYMVSMECDDEQSLITIDSIYAGNTEFSWNGKNSFDFKKVRAKDKAKYVLHFEESGDSKVNAGNHQTNRHGKKKGKDRIVYHSDGQRYELLIDKFRALPFLSYP